MRQTFARFIARQSVLHLGYHPGAMSARSFRSVSSLSIAEARRLTLAAQGFGARRVAESGGLRSLVAMLRRLGVVQIDSVNALVRAHYLPVFSRLGSYERTLLDRAAYTGRPRRLFEYWGHEASLISLELHPLFRWRMERARRGDGVWRGVAQFGREQPEFIAGVLDQIRTRGALGASELEAGGRSRGNWWGWSHGKRALEWLFWTGQVTTATRRNFERVYDLPERVLAREVLDAPTPPEEEAHRELMLFAAAALGVATERDVRDYFRLPVSDARARLAELVEAGALLPVTVEGWKQPAYLRPPVRIPRRVEASALLSPFDSLIWERQRTERLFGFHYRLEIYTPAHKRRHGYYVLPYLHGERLVARVDLKSDRGGRALLVLGGHAEAGVDFAAFAADLARDLERLARWLDLDRVEVRGGTSLCRRLRREFRL